jgi:hypothetical protein
MKKLALKKFFDKLRQASALEKNAKTNARAQRRA